MEKEQQDRKKFNEYLEAMRETYSEQVVDTLSSMDHNVLDLDLTAELLRYISLQKPEGAILVFLQGWDQISKLHDKLTSQTLFSEERFIIIPLHSMMPTINQRHVFEHPPPGVRKIIIATNIAETSITIDDVVYVVNLGRVKETNFDVANNIRTMKAEWVSKASAHQRRGRAGRVQDGECFHVYSQLKASEMVEYQLPEIKRTPLEELCLNIKTLKLGSVHPFISKAMETPDIRAIQLAISSLKQMRAFDDNEDLTALGYHLSRLPVEPRIGKMMLFGAMFCCLDPILTIAASLSWKDPFYIPLGKERLADERRRVLSNNTRSDHLMLANAMSGWEDAKEHRGEGSYCWQNFMSSNILSMLSKMKGQFCDVLHRLRFVSNRSPKHIDANRNSENEQLVKAVLCAGLYPKVAHVDKVPFNRKTGQNRPPRLSTPEDGRVQIHPKSVNANETTFSSKWLLYHLKLKSTSVFLHDTTMVEPYPLIFCGGKISWDDDQGHETVFVDDHIKFHCSQETAHLVIKLREELDRVMEQKITNPGPTNWSPASHEGRVMRAIIDILVMQSRDTYDNDDQGFVHSARGNNRHGGNDDDDDDDCYDDEAGEAGGGRQYGRSGNRYNNDDRPGSSHWRPDSHRRRIQGNPQQGFWTQK
ncbi:ATP-dependent DNA/RNA helicase DHX36 [Strongylocentrotus purpuratus]|uniref:Helicase C-terminal domain-containing protein n=1 Tax=Strongylocentrotus purpuratus TaxID=7668 RepID=A0A7M7PKU3_STRPU|nr:ATP-dependent DNA/RNA helicase DHX36 [Strongylocentrotus purpuratus]